MKLEPTEAEQKLIDAARDGQPAQYCSSKPEENNPADASAWGAERTIRAEVIYALATDGEARFPVHDKGICVIGAKITGRLDFDSAEITCPLSLIQCYLPDGASLRQARARHLVFALSEIGELAADGVHINGGLNLKRARVCKGVRLPLAQVDGNVECDGATLFADAQGVALHAEQMRVVGSVTLRDNFVASGRVTLSGARVEGQLASSSATFSAPSEVALVAEHLRVGMSLFLNSTCFSGSVCLSHAEIKGTLACDGSRFVAGQTGEALIADGIKVGGSVCLRDAFSAQGFGSNGVVRLPRAKIADSLDCVGGTFINAPIPSAIGQSGGEPLALVADGVEIGSAMRLQRVTCQGTIRLVNAKISGDMDFQYALFHEPSQVIAENAAIGGRFWWSKLARNPAVLSLLNAHANILVDDQASWPTKGNLFLDGFTYNTIGAVSRADANSRIHWLELQQPEYHSSQPYEQLEKVLRASGDENGARAIYIEKRRTVRRCGGLGRTARSWDWFLDRSIRYGYQTWRALVWALLIITFGALPFWNWFWNMQVPLVQTAAIVISTQSGMSAGAAKNLTVTPAPQRNPLLQGLDHFLFSFFYSLDVFLPFGDLHMKAAHPLQPRHTQDWWFYLYELWCVSEMMSGWVIAGLLAASVTGVTRR
jgi:hypothetical protein